MSLAILSSVQPQACPPAALFGACVLPCLPTLGSVSVPPLCQPRPVQRVLRLTLMSFTTLQLLPCAGRSLRAVHFCPCGAPLVLTAEVSEPSDPRLLPFTFEEASRMPFTVAHGLGVTARRCPSVGQPVEASEEPMLPDLSAASRRQALAADQHGAPAPSAADRLLLLADRQRVLQAQQAERQVGC